MTERKYRYAAACGKTTLYKFRAYSTEEQKQRVREILVEHKVYFARPTQLNDPFDMSPHLVVATREEFLAGAHRYFERNQDISADVRQRQLSYLEACDLEDHHRVTQKRIREHLDDNYWVFSLAGNRDHPMLWSHYASGHTGLCIHFRSTAESVFSAAIATIYSEDRAVINLDFFEPEQRGGALSSTVLRKGDFWSYEDEYRLCRFPDVDYSGLPIRFSGQHATIPASNLSGISLGARMSEKHVAELMMLAAEHSPPLPVWQVHESEGYDLKFRRIG